MELEREIARAKRTGQPYVLAFVDVDHLKDTNDSLGHAAGDELLRLIADTIRTNLRSYDLVVRFGGDEFVCGLPDLTMEASTARFRLINASLGQTRKASVTVGFAELGTGDSLEALLARSDEAMYQERKAGANNPLR